LKPASSIAGDLSGNFSQISPQGYRWKAAALGQLGRADERFGPYPVLGPIGIFLPGILVLIGTLPFWERKRAGAQAIMRGVNAAVVGLLGAALYNPVWTSSVSAPGDFGVALIGFVLLTVWRAPPLLVVFVSAIAGVVLAMLG
jgi:chromate transporter